MEWVAIIVSTFAVLVSALALYFNRKDRNGADNDKKIESIEKKVENSERTWKRELEHYVNKTGVDMEKVLTKIENVVKESGEIKYNYLTRFGSLERILHEMKLELTQTINEAVRMMQQETQNLLNKGDH